MSFMSSPLTKTTPLTDGDTPLLTVAGVKQMEAEYLADVQLLAELPARIARKKQRLDAARLFMPEASDLVLHNEAGKTVAAPIASAKIIPTEATTQRLPLPEGSTLIGAIDFILRTDGRGLSHKELMTRLEDYSFGPQLQKSDKGFYNGISRLYARGKLVKSGGLLYAESVAEDMKKSGKSLTDLTADIQRRTNSSASFVVEILQSHPRGLSAAELKQILNGMPEAPKSIREHGQYIYNVLSTLMASGTIVKKDGKYALAQSSLPSILS